MNNRSFIITYRGNLTPWEGLYPILTMITDLAETRSDTKVELRILGRIDQQAWNIIEEIGAQDIVIEVANAPDSLIQESLRQSDLLLFLSTDQTHGFPKELGVMLLGLSREIPMLFLGDAKSVTAKMLEYWETGVSFSPTQYEEVMNYLHKIIVVGSLKTGLKEQEYAS